jgi:hypothetical protein
MVILQRLRDDFLLRIASMASTLAFAAAIVVI